MRSPHSELQPDPSQRHMDRALGRSEGDASRGDDVSPVSSDATGVRERTAVSEAGRTPPGLAAATSPTEAALGVAAAMTHRVWRRLSAPGTPSGSAGRSTLFSI